MSKKNLITGLGICVVFIIILSVFLKIKEKQNIESIRTISEGTLLLSGMGIFSEEYRGELTAAEIRQKIQELVKEDIPGLYDEIKKYDDNKLEEYYNENSSNIKNKFGIKTETEFVEFANKLKKSKIDFNSWEKVEVIPETFIHKLENENYAYVEFNVIYKKEKQISFAVKIANTQIQSTRYIFIAK